MVLPCFYNAPVSYFSLFYQCKENIVIEIFDNYTKQTYRNRCRILGANGIIDLVIPVVKEHGKKIMMKDIRIDYDTSWNKTHWKSIFSAYSSSPFYEFMQDSFYQFYEKKYNFLSDLNLEITDRTLDLLQMASTYSCSESYLNVIPGDDARESVHPKRPFTHPEFSFLPARYHQVFSERHGFVPDLAVMDLLFNEGPNAGLILKSSLHKKA